MRKNIETVVYKVLGFVIAGAAMLAMVLMYFSSTFLPVYIGKTYVIGNQILRYALYILLAVITYNAFMLATYGKRFLIKKFHKKRRER